MPESIKIVECPRDAWQDREFIPTELKLEYIRRVRAAGVRHIDAVGFYQSFTDSEAVAQGLSAMNGAEIIGVVTGEAGLERALANRAITTVAYPYSISAHYRRANANLSRAESRHLVESMRPRVKAAGRGFTVYMAMAFGNPWNEPWGPEIVADTLEWLKDAGVSSVSLADTAGIANAETVANVYSEVRDCVAGVEIGVHLHSRPDRKSTRLNSSHIQKSRMPSSA